MRFQAAAGVTIAIRWGLAPPIAQTNWTRCRPSQGLKRETTKSIFQKGTLMLNLASLHACNAMTALLMAPLVLGHLAVMIYAIQGGLSAAEILGRTQGSVTWWFLFYGVFVVAVSIHGAIGLRVIAFEWAGLKGSALDGLMWIAGFGLFALGARAVWAVTFSSGLRA